MLTPASTGRAGGLTAPAEPPEVEGVVVEDEAVAGSDRLDEDRHLLVVDLRGGAAAPADEVMVVVRLTGDVGPGLPGAFEAPGETGVDEHVEGAEDRRPAQERVAAAQPLEELLGGDRPPGAEEGVGDDDPLGGEPPPRGHEPLRRRGAGRLHLAGVAALVTRSTHRWGARSSAMVGIISGPSQTRLSSSSPPAAVTASAKCSPTSYWRSFMFMPVTARTSRSRRLRCCARSWNACSRRSKSARWRLPTWCITKLL